MTDIAAGRLRKPGSCSSCEQNDVTVSWHVGSRRWYCDQCWPRPAGVLPAANAASERWSAGLETLEAVIRRRDHVHGIRVEDSVTHPVQFRVRCPEHGWIADGLSLRQARQLQDAHKVEHLRAEALDFPPAE